MCIDSYLTLDPEQVLDLSDMALSYIPSDVMRFFQIRGIGMPLFLSLALTRSLSRYLSLALARSLTRSFSLSRSLACALSLSLSLSLSRALSLSLSRSLSSPHPAPALPARSRGRIEGVIERLPPEQESQGEIPAEGGAVSARCCPPPPQERDFLLTTYWFESTSSSR